MMEQPAEDSSGERRRGGGTVLEWTVAALSAAMVLALVGFLLHDALTRSPSPPDLDVRSDSVVSVGAGHLVAVTVSNGGGRTAASVQLRGELLQGDSVLETSEAVLDYVPVGAHRHAGLQFERDPEVHVVRVRVVGYEEP